jgi:hypothetical protein
MQTSGSIKELSIQYLNSVAKITVMLLMLTALLAIFFLGSAMPQIGVDPSWHFAMNQAIAENLAIGKEIIFTFGPYSSLYTNEFNPSTDRLELFGGIYFSLCYFIAFAMLMKNTPIFWSVIFWALIAIFRPSDPIFISYPLLVSLVIFRIVFPSDQVKEIIFSPWLMAPMLFIIFSALGFLPLIKGSFLVPCASMFFACIAMLILGKKKLFAIIAFASPIIGMVFFWNLAGQKISVLTEYFSNMLQIISGYNEAMSLSEGASYEIAIFLIIALLVLLVIFMQKSIPLLLRLILFTLFFSFLFVSFKGGFVRHDVSHPSIQSASLLIAALLLPFVFHYQHPFILQFFGYKVAWIPLVSFVAWLSIGNNYTHFSAQRILYSSTNQVALFSHLSNRIFHPQSFVDAFKKNLAQIKIEAALPKLDGTTDIYPYDQSNLIASDNEWSPRPIFQSYSSYTAKLSQINARHLIGENAPKNIFFKVRTMDERFPSIDDGLSWKILLANYQPIKTSGQFLVLRRKAIINSLPSQEVEINNNYQLGEIVKIPNGNKILFAEIEIKLTLFGKLLSTLFKPSQLQINVTLDDGRTENYRIASTMIKSGFVISPLVENAADFSSLYNARASTKRVKSFIISSRERYKFFWQPVYKINISAIKALRIDNNFKPQKSI